MHPMQADNVVIDPNYPPQFFPYLYPHLYPHLFPKLYPHYCKNYNEIMHKKKKKKNKHEKRDIVVVLPDGRNIMMSRKEFLSYQLALAQMGHKVSEKDLTSLKKDPLFEDNSKDDVKSVALSANIPSELQSPSNIKKKIKKNDKDSKNNNKDDDSVLNGLDKTKEGPGGAQLLDPVVKSKNKIQSKQPTPKASSQNSKKDNLSEDL